MDSLCGRQRQMTVDLTTENPETLRIPDRDLLAVGKNIDMATSSLGAESGGHRTYARITDAHTDSRLH